MNLDNKFTIFNAEKDGYLGWRTPRWRWQNKPYPIVLGVIRSMQAYAYPAGGAIDLADDLIKIMEKNNPANLWVYPCKEIQFTQGGRPKITWELDHSEMRSLREWNYDDWRIPALSPN